MSNKVEQAKNFICLYATRGDLNSIALRFGFDNACKMSRTKLENIYYCIHVLGLNPDSYYTVFIKNSTNVLIKKCTTKYLIQWIMRECIFNWYEEQETPCYKKLNLEISILHCID